MKTSQLDREIAKVDAEIATLQAVRVRLVAAQSAKPKRKPAKLIGSEVK